MLGKLGKVEKIGVLHNEISNSAAGRIDLSGIDWGSYQAVVLSAADYADAAYTFTISAEGTASTRSTSSASNSSLGVVNAAPYLLIFLPLGDSSRTVRLLYIGGSAGMGTATCTFDIAIGNPPLLSQLDWDSQGGFSPASHRACDFHRTRRSINANYLLRVCEITSLSL